MPGEENYTRAGESGSRQGRTRFGDKIRLRSPALKRAWASKTARGFACAAALAISAAAFYRVRELLAALLLFSILFGVVIVGVLILWLVEEVAHKAAVEVEHHLPHLTKHHVPAPARTEARHSSGGGSWS